MNERAKMDAYGALSEPATLTIQRMLPGPSSGSGPISPKAICAANGWRPATWR